MANENEEGKENINVQSENKDISETLDFDEIEKKLQEELELELSDLNFMDEQSTQIGNPDVLGEVILNTIWEQFNNQIAIQAGKDFIKSNKGMRLDLRNDAHIQTTDNFENGKIATHNTEIDYQKRHDDWQNNFKKNKDGNIQTNRDSRTGEEKKVLRAIPKHPTEQDKNNYNTNHDARKFIDNGRPTGSKTVHKDHTISAAEIIRDPAAAAHMEREEQATFANSTVNLMDIDSSANQSKRDSTMTEWLDSERTGKNGTGVTQAEYFGVDDEELRSRDKVAREEYEKLKKEAEQTSIKAGKTSQKAEAFRISKKAVRAVVMSLLTDLIKKIIRELVVWLKNKEKNLKSLLNSINNAIVLFVSNLREKVVNVVEVAATVIATSILGPIISTVKKAWMFIKQGWTSLKQAVEYIRDPKNKNKPVGLLMMEAGKIIMAGFTVMGAIVLGEAIEKGLMLIPILAVEIPFLGSLANIIGIFMGAVVSGILGALAIKLINDLIKEKQKQQLDRDKIDKQNEILNSQNEIVDINKKKFEMNKEQAISSIISRHEEATNIMQDSLDNIFSNNDEKNDKEFDHMNVTLNLLTD